MDEVRGNQFVTTQWSMILAAPADSQGAVTDGLTKLCEDYRESVFHFLNINAKIRLKLKIFARASLLN